MVWNGTFRFLYFVEENWWDSGCQRSLSPIPEDHRRVFFTFQDEVFPQTDRLHFSFLKMTVVKPFSKLTNYFLTVWGIFLALFILWISLNVCRFFCAPVALLQKCTNFYWISPILCPDLWTLVCIVDSTLFLNFAE